jgi:hypothetical protein
MRNFSLAHLSDAALLRELSALVSRERLTTAELLAHIAEVDARKLYVPAGHPSMHAYCVIELRLSEDAAGRRIQAARAARRFPDLFSAVADGRLHLTAVCLLAPHLTPSNVDELVQMASNQTKAEIEVWLTRCFGAPEPRTLVRPLPPAPPILAPALAHADEEAVLSTGKQVNEHALAHVEAPEPELAPERYLVQVTIPKSTHDKLRHAQALLSHAVPRGDVAQVLDRALDSLIAQLEKQKVGASQRPQRRHRPSNRARHVPAHVRRAVWERDGGQCTFVSSNGRRCTSRKFLEFDHIEPVARGGTATVGGMRLRCRAHNQYEAERAFGSGFMRAKREQARVMAAKEEGIRDVIAGLRGLGCRAEEAHRAAEFSGTLHGAPLEERIRAALRYLGSKRTARNPVRHDGQISTLM